ISCSFSLRCEVTLLVVFFFFQAEDGIRDKLVTGVQTCALPISQGIAVDSNIASQAEAVRQALLGGPQLEKVARLAMPGYAGASPERQATIIDGLRKRLQVEASGERNQPADLYMITYTDRDRRTAHRVVDQLLRLF